MFGQYIEVSHIKLNKGRKEIHFLRNTEGKFVDPYFENKNYLGFPRARMSEVRGRHCISVP